MKTPVLVALAAVLVTSGAMAQDQSSAAVPTKGQMLITANGSRLAPVYRVGSDGSATILVDFKMLTIPATTLSNVDGKLTTSLTKSEVLALH